MNRFGLSPTADVRSDLRTGVAIGHDLHLDQFMGIQSLLDLCDDCVLKAMLSDPDHRLEMVAQGTQVAFLCFGKFHRPAPKKGRHYTDMRGMVHSKAG